MNKILLTAVVIPVYKNLSKLSQDDLNSIENTLKLMQCYDVYFIGPRNIANTYISRYNKSFSKDFSFKYFKSVYTYNELLLKREFYDEFIDYDYLLVVHSDAWVFSVDFTPFMKYDYIGAPWINPPIYLNNYDSTSGGLVGNGGLSLRRLDFIRQVLSCKTRMFSRRELLFNARQISFKVNSKNNLIYKCFFYLRILYLGLFYNRFCYGYKWARFINEDVYFGVLSLNAGDFSYPDPIEAARFSIEFDVPGITDDIEPFGIHSFKKRSKKIWQKYLLKNV